ncbi:EAP30/Vps36 family-domain-containing protein [Lipomyces arxii]|uniref:EAP30/Vps36 family-domain-containing protein n=1 Tax=Lipomyces arxii TaxID=56418 RepID=UPI0034CF2344
MYLWHQIDLTSTRRLVLLPDEVDILVQNDVGIYEGRTKLQQYQNGRLYLTTHRVCYVDNLKPNSHSVAVNLSQVNRIQYNPKLLRSSPKISLYLQFGSRPLTPETGVLKSNMSAPVLISPDHARSITPDANAAFTWICPICSFANRMKFAESDGPAQACMTCGVKPGPSVIETAKNTALLSVQPSHTYATPLPEGVTLENGFECPLCTFVNHPSLHYCEMCGTALISQNIPPTLVDNAMKDLALQPHIGDFTSADDGELAHIKISFHAGGEKVFLDRLKLVIQDRVWDRRMYSTHHHSHKKHHTDNILQSHVPRIGIQALQVQHSRERLHNLELLKSLDDLESLMDKAKEMVTLAESFAKSLANAPGVPKEARVALSQSSNALSLSSPLVMREMAGGGDELFYSELARQIAEFLDRGVLRSEGGILTLFDLYALYNRARGISLISPKDFYNSCSIFWKLGLPFRLRKFKSGLTVVQEASKSEVDTTRMLVEWIGVAQNKPFGEEGGISAQDVHEKYGWSVAVCVEELEMAQDQGQICSDAVIEGTRFFINIFV